MRVGQLAVAHIAGVFPPAALKKFITPSGSITLSPLEIGVDDVSVKTNSHRVALLWGGATTGSGIESKDVTRFAPLVLSPSVSAKLRVARGSTFDANVGGFGAGGDPTQDPYASDRIGVEADDSEIGDPDGDPPAEHLPGDFAVERWSCAFRWMCVRTDTVECWCLWGLSRDREWFQHLVDIGLSRGTYWPVFWGIQKSKGGQFNGANGWRDHSREGGRRLPRPPLEKAAGVGPTNSLQSTI